MCSVPRKSRFTGLGWDFCRMGGADNRHDGGLVGAGGGCRSEVGWGGRGMLRPWVLRRTVVRVGSDLSRHARSGGTTARPVIADRRN